MADFTDKHFQQAFCDANGKPYEVPLPLKMAVIRVCRSYDIGGICDPMYIANVIALELGLGDGRSNFYGFQSFVKDDGLTEAGRFFLNRVTREGNYRA